MYKVVEPISKLLTRKKHFTSYDFCFLFNTKLTTALLLLFSVLLSALELLRTSIDCYPDSKDRKALMDNYCWSTGTYTCKNSNSKCNFSPVSVATWFAYACIATTMWTFQFDFGSKAPRAHFSCFFVHISLKTLRHFEKRFYRSLWMLLFTWSEQNVSALLPMASTRVHPSSVIGIPAGVCMERRRTWFAQQTLRQTRQVLQFLHSKCVRNVPPSIEQLIDSTTMQSIHRCTLRWAKLQREELQIGWIFQRQIHGSCAHVLRWPLHHL